MRETWLRPNRRAILFGCVPPLVLAAIGAWLAFALGESAGNFWHWLGLFLMVASLAMIGIMLTQLRHPRIAFRDGMVLFYVRIGQPIAVPVEIVESFFFGQGPAHLPAVPKQPQTVNLIARLSQRHTGVGRARKCGRLSEAGATVTSRFAAPGVSRSTRS